MSDAVRLGFTHVWCGRRFLPERHGQPCRLLTAHRRKFVLEFADGFTVSTVRTVAAALGRANNHLKEDE